MPESENYHNGKGVTNLSNEMKELIEKVLDLIKNRSTERKIELIYITLQVVVDVQEIAYPESILREIIFSRIARTCPECHGESLKPNTLIPCNLCNGQGEVSGVIEKKFYLEQIKKQ